MNDQDAMRDRHDDEDLRLQECRDARAAYVAACNALAERNGSRLRAAAVEGPGLSGQCFVVVVPVSVLAGLTPEDLAWDRDERLLSLLQDWDWEEGKEEASDTEADDQGCLSCCELVVCDPQPAASPEEVGGLVPEVPARDI
jgi:hypothetical protein